MKENQKVIKFDKGFQLKLGYLLNFGKALMKTGITRTVNGLEETK